MKDVEKFDEEDPILATGRKIVEDSRLLHEKHQIILNGGGADGQTLNIPEGVNTLTVEHQGIDYKYLRSAKKKDVFEVSLT